MKDSAPRKKAGPKPREIDIEQVRVLASMQCTYEEIAAVVKFKKRQFIDRVNASPELKEVIEEGWANGRASIRRQQFALLAAGNPTMAIWLGKQYLGQRDHFDLAGQAGGPIQIDVSPRELLLSRINSLATRLRADRGAEGAERPPS